jgi:Uma2 family endonuclease
MLQSLPKTLTLEEFLQLPETKPAREYIDGRIIPKPMPRRKHSTIQGELVPAINNVLKTQNIARAFPELRCTFGGRSTVPDIAVFLWERIPRDGKGEIADIFACSPDWTIEILSPEQNHTKVIKNILHCLENGTQMSWLIDPAEQTIFIYFPDRTVTLLDTPELLIPAPNFARELQLTVGELFGWLRQ